MLNFGGVVACVTFLRWFPPSVVLFVSGSGFHIGHLGGGFKQDIPFSSLLGEMIQFD